jgi:hypothetical protein
MAEGTRIKATLWMVRYRFEAVSDTGRGHKGGM